nr:hypothetical protein CFP56_70983 [Quercus suber]
MERDDDRDGDDGHVGREPQPGEKSCWRRSLGQLSSASIFEWIGSLLRSAAQWSRASESLLSKSKGPGFHSGRKRSSQNSRSAFDGVRAAGTGAGGVTISTDQPTNWLSFVPKSVVMS